MKNDDAKKSEMLEVRVSYDTKRKLSEQAKSEGRTVSDVVRKLIDSYLAHPISMTHNSKLGDAIMFIKNLFIQKPKTTLAAMAAVMMSGLLFIPTATAENLTLDIEGEFVEPSHTNGSRTKTFKTQVELNFGEMIIMRVNGQPSVSTYPIISEDGDWVKLEVVDETENKYGDKGVSIRLSIVNKNSADERIMAQPNLMAVYDEAAEFKMVTEFFEDGTFIANGGKRSYTLKLTPRLKS